jgi:hypothetical protein
MRAGIVAQVVEIMSSKHKTLHSNSSTTKKRKREYDLENSSSCRWEEYINEGGQWKREGEDMA